MPEEPSSSCVARQRVDLQRAWATTEQNTGNALEVVTRVVSWTRLPRAGGIEKTRPWNVNARTSSSITRAHWLLEADLEGTRAAELLRGLGRGSPALRVRTRWTRNHAPFGLSMLLNGRAGSLRTSVRFVAELLNDETAYNGQITPTRHKHPEAHSLGFALISFRSATAPSVSRASRA